MRDRYLFIMLILFLSCYQLDAQEKRILENGKTYLIHVVEKGETIFSLSKTYDVKKKELLNANPGLLFGLKTGQELKILVPDRAVVQLEESSTQELKPSFHTYKVKRKDALHFIAKRYAVEVDDILKYNPGLKPKLKKGQLLLIPDIADLERIRAMQKQIEKREELAKPKTHKVLGDETLYSLSKKYERSIASILDANPEARNGLRIGMELLIPEKESKESEVVESADGFFIYLVETGETFWSLERRYHVSRDVLEKHNPVLEHGLLAGLRIHIPISELPRIEVEPVDEHAFEKHEVTLGETLYSLSNQYQVNISDLKTANPVLAYRGLMAGETILIPKKIEIGSIDIQEPYHVEHAIRIVDSKLPKGSHINYSLVYDKFDVALLMPFYLNANDTVNRIPFTQNDMLLDSAFMSQIENIEELPANTFKNREELIIYPRSEHFVHFYEGVLLAVDSLQKAGMNVELHVFDTNQNSDVLDSLIQLDVFRELDLIIGPVFPQLQQVVSDFAYKNRIPMVSPLSSAGSYENKNPWYFKVNPTKDYLIRKTADFIGEEYFQQNLIVLQMGEYKHLPEATLVDLCREKFFSSRVRSSVNELNFHEYNFQAEGYWGLRRILSKDKENIFIIPSETEAQVSVAISNINSLSDTYSIRLVGLSNFQRYRSIQTEYFHHVKLQLYSPYFVDYESDLTNRFISKFRTNYSADPNQFSFQGYDVAFYFMSALFRYGKGFVDSLPSHHVQLNQGEFFFDKVSRFGGYMNRGLFLVDYKKNFDVTVDHVVGVPALLLAE